MSHVRRETGGRGDTTRVVEASASYMTALKINGKSHKTIESYANSLEDFRRV